MKIQRSKQAQERASVLVITIILLVIVGTTLGSYLMLSSMQAKSVNRSQNWGNSLDMAEAGIEDALAHMNTTPNELDADTWGGGAGGIYGPRSNGLASGYYNVAINTNGSTTIYSTGYVAVALAGDKVKRVVKVTVTQLPLFNIAFAAVNNIDMNGNGAATDSFNSSSSSTSTSNNVGWYDPTKVGTNGDVGSEYGIVDIGNHTIQGDLYLGPTASYISGTGNVTGNIYYDYNVQIPDPQEPIPTPSWTPTANGVDHIFSTLGTNYYLINDSKSVTVMPGAHVLVKVTTQDWSPPNLQIYGATNNNSGTIVIYHEPSSSGGSMTFSGNTTVNGGKASDLIYYGFQNVSDISLSGTSAFIGVIYAPYAAMEDNGGGANVNFIGSCVVKSLKMNGHYNFHYDEALGGLPIYRGYIPSSWQEL